MRVRFSIDRLSFSTYQLTTRSSRLYVHDHVHYKTNLFKGNYALYTRKDPLSFNHECRNSFFVSSFHGLVQFPFDLFAEYYVNRFGIASFYHVRSQFPFVNW